MKEIILIRPAIKADIENLLQFEQGVISTERPFDPTIKPHPAHYYDLEQMIENPKIELVVAEVHGKTIGSGYARIEAGRHFVTYGDHAYLGFMFVDPEWRGKGVNQLIIEYLKQWAKSKGLIEMRLEVYVDNFGAVKAYEKVGFEKLMYEMRLGI